MDFLLVALVVAAVLLAFAAYIWLGAAAMGFAWPYDSLDAPFWGTGRWKCAAILFVVTVFGISAFVVALSGDSAKHGSCKYDHWGGKSYYCDEYYPLPEHRG